jgi:acyl carrier protein
MVRSAEEVVVAAIARHKGLDPATVTPDVELTALGITSLDAITIAYDVEEAFGVEIPNEDLDSLRTVQDLIDGLQRLLDRRG